MPTGGQLVIAHPLIGTVTAHGRLSQHPETSKCLTKQDALLHTPTPDSHPWHAAGCRLNNTVVQRSDVDSSDRQSPGPGSTLALVVPTLFSLHSPYGQGCLRADLCCHNVPCTAENHHANTVRQCTVHRCCHSVPSNAPTTFSYSVPYYVLSSDC
jgi:hypothetical protein